MGFCRSSPPEGAVQALGVQLQALHGCGVTNTTFS